MLRLSSATAIIAILTVAVSALAIVAGLDGFVVSMGFIPARIAGILELPGAFPALLTPFSSALIHGGWVHLMVNMLMLTIAGTQVERVVGWSGVLIAYVAGAMVAALAQFVAQPDSLVPMVGASGAISALFGLYALFYGRPKQVTRNQSLNRMIHVAWLLAAWIVIQWMSGMIAGGQGVMLATPAHIGGFVAGLLLQRPLLLWRYRGA